MPENSDIEVTPATKAQNPDLETAWRTIVWWQQTCAYWHDEAHKGYRLRDSLTPRRNTPVVPEADWDAYLEESYVDPAERDLP